MKILVLINQEKFSLVRTWSILDHNVDYASGIELLQVKSCRVRVSDYADKLSNSTKPYFVIDLKKLIQRCITLGGV